MATTTESLDDSLPKPGPPPSPDAKTRAEGVFHPDALMVHDGKAASDEDKD